MRLPAELDWLMMLRRRLAPGLLGLAAGLAAGPEAWADDVLPKAFPASRYAKLGAHSPFSPPTAAAAVPMTTAAPAGSWADKLSVALLMEQGGKYVATVVDRDSAEHFLVTSDGGNDKNMTLSSVQWGDKPNQTRVTIRKGTEFGQVAFDPNATAASSAAAPMLPGVFPRTPPMAPGVFHPPPAPNVGFNGPRTPSVIVRRPPISSGQPTFNNPRNPLGRVTTQTSDDDDDDDN
jgi:hypothetical protein